MTETPTPTSSGAGELLAVEQVDRDAAASIIGGWWRNLKEKEAGDIVRGGLVDNNPLVQAFARHRLATLTHPISREAMISAICDPGKLAGFRGWRSMAEWTADAIISLIGRADAQNLSPPCCLGVVEALEALMFEVRANREPLCGPVHKALMRADAALQSHRGEGR